MRYGPQAQQVFDLLRQNANAQAQLRAPIFEDKVVDLIVEKAKVQDTKVSKDDLMKDDDLPEGYGGDEVEKPAKSSKKAAAKTEAEPKAEKKTAPKKAAAKKE